MNFIQRFFARAILNEAERQVRDGDNNPETRRLLRQLRHEVDERKI